MILFHSGHSRHRRRRELFTASGMPGPVVGAVLVILAALMVWRLIDLFKKKGRWTKEVDQKLEIFEEEKR